MFRMVGTTDDCTTCEQCGKAELKMTVILMPIDKDGADDGEVIYAGSTCAARLLWRRTGKPVTARDVTTAASMTERIWSEARRWVAEFEGMTFNRFAAANSTAALNASQSTSEALELLRGWFGETQDEIAVIKAGSLTGTRWEKNLPTF